MPPVALRNIALVAHVDHGKTTLVDGLLRIDRGVRRPCRRSSTASWTRTTRSESAGSRSWPRPRRSPGKDVQDQPGRHPGPRRLRRRGRTSAGHGRRRAAAGRCGRGSAAPDPLRAVKGARRRPARPCWSSTRWTGPTPGRRRCSTRSTSCSWTSAPRTRTSSSRSSRPWPVRVGPSPGVGMPAADADLTPLLEAIVDTIPGSGLSMPTDRCRRSSPTSTRPTTSAGWPSDGCVGEGSARGERVALLDEEVDEGEKPLERKLSPLLGLRRRGPRRGRRTGGRRPVRPGRLPRGGDRRHAGRPGPTRAAAPPRASTSRCCA